MPVPEHIQIARVPRPPQARRKITRYVPRNPRHTAASHAPKLEDDARQSLDALRARTDERPDLDPKLMLRFSLNRRIGDDAWRPAGLTLLDSSDRHAAVAFAARSDLDRFLKRLGQYEQGPRDRPQDKPATEGQDDELPALFEDFFDAIDEFRPLEPTDRISGRLNAIFDGAPDSIHEYDVELWFHSDAAVREDWLAETRALVDELGGEWVDEYVGVRAAIVLARVRGNHGVALGLAELDQVSLVDAIPSPSFGPEELIAMQDAALLPEEIPSPPEDAPVVGMIDTGVRAGHPLLRSAIVDVAAIDEMFGGQGEDAHGHGTSVAGLLLFGDVLAAVRQGEPQLFFWLASVRVLDDDGRPPA
ncbi:MAG: S8 family serine peptidase, partial [Solirubrobacterales bacterium]